MMKHHMHMLHLVFKTLAFLGWPVAASASSATPPHLEYDLVFVAAKADGSDEPITYQFRLGCGPQAAPDTAHGHAQPQNICTLHATRFGKCIDHNGMPEEGLLSFFTHHEQYRSDSGNAYDRLDIRFPAPGEITLHTIGLTPRLHGGIPHFDASIHYETTPEDGPLVRSFSGTISWEQLENGPDDLPPAVQLIHVKGPNVQLHRSCPLGLVTIE